MLPYRKTSLAALLGLVASLAGCGEKSTDPRLEALLIPQPGDARALFDAKSSFANACALCHGSEGRGDGPRAGALNPRPRSYHDQGWQQSVSDDRIREVIRYGGTKHGLSAAMPPAPESVLSDAALEELVRIIRELGRLGD